MGRDVVRHPDQITALVDGVLTSPGTTGQDLRRAVEARAGALSGRRRADAVVPEALSEWIEKVARHAYKTTDQDIASLRAAGYSEDQIFEVTVAAAIGASRARLERALEAVQSADEG